MQNVVRTSDLGYVSHGSWEYDTDDIPVCSVCEGVAPQRLYVIGVNNLDLRYKLTRYCPECGAIMDGEPSDG